MQSDGGEGPDDDGRDPSTTPVESDRGFYQSVVENARELITAFDLDGTIRYVNPHSELLLGFPPREGIGKNLADFMHPDDLPRALVAMEGLDEFGAPRGTASMRMRHVDGSWVPVEFTGGTASRGDQDFLVAFGRHGAFMHSARNLLVALLRGDAIVEVMEPVLDSFSWQDLGSLAAITWTEHEEERVHVSTGLPDVLGGVLDRDPWTRVRESGEATYSVDLGGLDDEVRTAAERSGRGAYWIVPIDHGGPEPALVTIWTGAGARPPEVHEHGMSIACSLVEVVLRFAEQRRQLDHAASHDPLTGLANRKTLMEELGAGGGGALLYCDLDRFKPVNDELGHAAGDELLRLVAARIVGCVRDEDLVARLGGDEFIVLCREVSRAHTDDVADRILAALHRPFMLDGGELTVGVSIGAVHRARGLGADALEIADAALYEAKQAGRGVMRWER